MQILPSDKLVYLNGRLVAPSFGPGFFYGMLAYTVKRSGEIPKRSGCKFHTCLFSICLSIVFVTVLAIFRATPNIRDHSHGFVSIRKIHFIGNPSQSSMILLLPLLFTLGASNSTPRLLSRPAHIILLNCSEGASNPQGPAPERF